MKANNGTGNTSQRDDWQTPKLLYDDLARQYGFDFDLCATKENSKCQIHTNTFELIRYIDLHEYICWMNPPFSQAKEMFEQFFRVVHKGVAIYRCDNMETSVWQDVILKHATWILIPKGRICYEGHDGKGSRFPSALIGYDVPVPKTVQGRLLYPLK